MEEAVVRKKILLWMESRNSDIIMELVDQVCKPMLIHILGTFHKFEMLADCISEAYIALTYETGILNRLNMDRPNIKPYIYLSLRNMIISILERENRHAYKLLTTDVAAHMSKDFDKEETSIAGLQNYVLKNTPEEYVLMVECLLDDLYSIQTQNKEVMRTLQALFDITPQVSKYVVDLVTLLVRVYWLDDYQDVNIQHKKALHKNPYMHIMCLRFGENVTLEMLKLFHGIINFEHPE